MRKLVMKAGLVLSLGLTVGLDGCESKTLANPKTAQASIIQMLHAQDAAWNSGDIDGFMSYYDKSPDLRFASGGHVTYGWEKTRARYHEHYENKAKMGALEFSDLKIKVLSPEYAQVFGHWELTRKTDRPAGLFTLLVHKTDAGWKIVSDHTSSDPTRDPVISDPISIDPDYPPMTVELDFLSGGKALNGHLYLADGKGPHPTVILLHGFPGYEKNLDLAQVMRRAGYNVLFFHYRGAWGSEGNFSMVHVIEDARAAVHFLQEPDVAAKYRIDPERLILLGHSLGGFASLEAGAAEKSVKCVGGISPADYGIRGDMFSRPNAEAALKGFVDYVDAKHLKGPGPLKGITGQGMINEIRDHMDEFSITNKTADFHGRHVLLIAAEKDTTLPPDVYDAALYKAFKNTKAVDLTHKILPGDHSYSWSRIALSHTVLNWLNTKCR